MTLVMIIMMVIMTVMTLVTTKETKFNLKRGRTAAKEENNPGASSSSSRRDNDSPDDDVESFFCKDCGTDVSNYEYEEDYCADCRKDYCQSCSEKLGDFDDEYCEECREDEEEHDAMDARDYASSLQHRLNMTLPAYITNRYTVREVLGRHTKECAMCYTNGFEERGWYVDRDGAGALERGKFCLDCAEGMCQEEEEGRGFFSSY